jgi:hypothetical protein
VNFQSYYGDTKSWDPDGAPGPAGTGFEREDLRPGSLICRIGSTWYQGGVRESFVARADGVLFLQPNDKIGGMSNNSGYWSVSVDVTPPADVATTQSFDANGMSVSGGSQSYAPALRKYSLVCRVGTTWHQGGTATEFIAVEDGELILQPNDKVGDLENNSGGWQVTLEVTAPTPDTPVGTAEPSLILNKRTGGSVAVARTANGWPVGDVQLQLHDIESVAITTPGARAQDIGFLALTFRFRSRDFRIVFPTRLRPNAAATVFHADVPADLVSHLLDHRLYYSQVVWRSLDPGTIGMLLSGYTWQLGGQSRRLVEIADPRPVAVVANYLVLRLSGDVAAEYQEWVKRTGLKVGSTREDEVPIPTGGVFAEAVLGRSNSAEKLDITRFWDWQESPIPIEAPEIAAVQTGSRGNTDTTVPGQLGQPVLNIVNPPALPDPQGMSAILAAIQNGNLFRDMSGLAATIGLAQASQAAAGQGAGQAGNQAGANAAIAAQLGAQVAEIAGQIVAAYLTKGASVLGSGAGGLLKGVGGNSKSGSVLNYAREMDQRGVPPALPGGTSPNGGAGSSGGTPGGAGTPGGGAATPGSPNGYGYDGRDPASTPSWERQAMNATLGTDPGITLASGRDLLANPIRRAVGVEAKQLAAEMLLHPRQIRWPEGREMIPGTIYWGNTMLVDADPTVVYYMKDDVLYAMATDAFLRDALISAYLDAVTGAEALVRLANIEVAFLSGVFAAVPVGSTSVFAGIGAVAAANFVHFGLKARANRNELADAGEELGKLLDARRCLQHEAPAMLDDLESSVAWRALRELPSQITAEQVAFWVGRLIRGFWAVGEGGAELTLGAAAKVLGLTTLALSALNSVLNSPAALERAIEEQSRELARDLGEHHVTVAHTKTAAWLKLLSENPRARQCLDDMANAAKELLRVMQVMNPRLMG